MKQFVLLQGRLGRFAYGLQLAVVVAPLVVVHPLVEAGTSSWAHVGFATVLVVVCTALAGLLAVRRLHDLKLSGWFALGLLVPGVNLPALLLLLLLPGSPGENRWGLPPLSPLRFPAPLFNLGWFRMVLPRRVRLGR